MTTTASTAEMEMLCEPKPASSRESEKIEMMTTIARVSIALGARGSAKLQTLTALDIEEFLGAVS